MEQNEDLTFEDALKRLEEIVHAMEGESITLEESVALYKEGARCGSICRKKLEEARHELEIWQEGMISPGGEAGETGEEPWVPF